MNKKQEGMLQAYKQAEPIADIYCAYNRPSQYKVVAFNECERERTQRKGYAAKIVSHNCAFFIYAYRFDQDGKTWLYYDTGRNVYVFPID